MNRIVTLSSLLAVITAALATGCKGPRCSSTDLDCFLEHMVLVEPKQGGAPIELTKINKSTLAPGPGTTTCSSGTLCNGACVDLTSDRGNCGSCGAVCEGGKKCNLGYCSCPSPCVSANGQCANLASDPQNCGACGNVCPPGKVCSGASCVDACAPEQTLCSQGCASTQSDDQNCGSCGNVCPAAYACSAGVCTCFALICMPTEGPAPAITNQPPAMEITEGNDLEPLDLDWTDPNECQPAFCAHLCSKNGRCSSGFMCSQPKSDHLLQGVFRSYLGFLAEPADGDVQLDTGIVPVSAPSCPDDLLEQLEAGGTPIDIGAEVKIEVMIDQPVSAASSSGSSSGGTVQCSDEAATCNCSVKACASTDGSCWYETTNGRFDCNGCGSGCQAAANALVQSCCPMP